MSNAPQMKVFESYFGPKMFTREQFLTRWAAHYSDLYKLLEYRSPTYQADLQRMDDGKRFIMQLAERVWDNHRE